MAATGKEIYIFTAASIRTTQDCQIQKYQEMVEIGSNLSKVNVFCLQTLGIEFLANKR